MSSDKMPATTPQPTADDLREMRAQYPLPLHDEYHHLLENTAAGRQLRKHLEDDPRVLRLNNQMLRQGTGGYLFDISKLGCWFLWRAAEKGSSQATDELNAFLNNDLIDVIVTKWVLGITVPKPIDLGNGISLVPADHLPTSPETIETRRVKFLYRPFGSTVPEAALIKRISVPKVCKTSNGGDPIAESQIQNASDQLRRCAILLNALDGVQAEPSLATGYVEASIPVGPFSGYGGSRPTFDVTTRENRELSVIPKVLLAELIAAFDQCSEKEQRRLELILFRIGQAKRRTSLPDKILDIGIVLEMLLLCELSSRDQLSLTFRLRGSWLLGNSVAERETLFNELRDLYSLRSQVAHSGTLGDKVDQQEMTSKAGRYEQIACMTFRKLLRNGAPQWSRLLLGET